MPSGPGGLRSRLKFPKRNVSTAHPSFGVARGDVAADPSPSIDGDDAREPTQADLPDTSVSSPHVPSAMAAETSVASGAAAGDGAPAMSGAAVPHGAAARGRDAPIRSWMITTFSRFHGWLYDRTDGRVGGRLIGRDMALLWHTGRKSGRTFRTALLCVPDGDDIMVVASFFGNAQHPQWYRNLEASPHCVVRYKRWKGAAIARTCHGQERAERWQRLIDRWPAFEGYASQTDRELPVVVIKRAEDER